MEIFTAAMACDAVRENQQSRALKAFESMPEIATDLLDTAIAWSRVGIVESFIRAGAKILDASLKIAETEKFYDVRKNGSSEKILSMLLAAKEAQEISADVESKPRAKARSL